MPSCCGAAGFLQMEAVKAALLPLCGKSVDPSRPVHRYGAQLLLSSPIDCLMTEELAVFDDFKGEQVCAAIPGDDGEFISANVKIPDVLRPHRAPPS